MNWQKLHKVQHMQLWSLLHPRCTSHVTGPWEKGWLCGKGHWHSSRQDLAMWCPVLDSPVQDRHWHARACSVADRGLEYTMYEERLRELDLFGLYEIRVGEYIIAVFSNLTGRYRKEGVRLFSKVHSNRMRSSRDKLQHRKSDLWLDVWKGILPWGWSDTWTVCLDKLGYLNPWGLSKLRWVRLWTAWSSWTRFEWEVGLYLPSEALSNLHNSLVLKIN